MADSDTGNAQNNRRSFVKRAGAFLASFGLGAAGANAAEAAPKEKANENAPKEPVGTVIKDDDDPLFSSVIVHDGLVYLSGIGAHFEGDIKDHTDHVLNEMEKNLEEAGSSMEQALKVGVFLHDLKDYEAMNEVFRGRFGDNPPVRTTVATYGGVPGDSLVEMDCIAALD